MRVATALLLLTPLLVGCPSNVEVPLCSDGAACSTPGEGCTTNFPTMACQCSAGKTWQCTGQDLSVLRELPDLSSHD